MTRFVVAAALAAALSLPAAASAQDTEWNRYTLEELGGVHVTADVDESCAPAGVTGAALVAAAEGVLNESEVELLTEMGMLANPGLPELKLAIHCVAGDGGAMAFSTTVRLYQAVQMVRDPQITLSESVTWFAESVGMASGADAAAAITQSVSDRAGEFAAAYVAANAG